ncbi:MAG: sel1 repeat family protein [Alistipes sp.]|nr:sel1 repeat family protein [Alistipes sp.]
MYRKISFTLLLCVAVLIPSIAAAQFFAKQNVLVWEVRDRNNDVELSDGTKTEILTNLRNAFVKSYNYQAFEDVVGSVKSGLTSQSPIAIAQKVRQSYPKVKYVVFTTVKVLERANSYDEYTLLLESDLFSTETLKSEKTAVSMLRSHSKYIPEACNTLLSQLLGEKQIASEGAQPSHESPEELYQKGYALYKQKQYVDAIPYIRRAAERGYAKAQFRLGYCYAKGNGLEKDNYQAVKWYHKAAEQGHATAQYNLGLRYENGGGVEQDYYEAVKWYRKAAEKRYAKAQSSLGDCYYYGNGVSKDYYEAVKWFRKAAEQGNVYGQYCLGYCYNKGQGVSQDRSEAIIWLRKAAQNGSDSAKEELEKMGVSY